MYQVQRADGTIFYCPKKRASKAQKTKWDATVEAIRLQEKEEFNRELKEIQEAEEECIDQFVKSADGLQDYMSGTLTSVN